LFGDENRLSENVVLYKVGLKMVKSNPERLDGGIFGQWRWKCVRMLFRSNIGLSPFLAIGEFFPGAVKFRFDRECANNVNLP